ncbi:acyl-CoA dehydrogenase family protein [Phyllobacterium sp. 21LDTY02-6]|uniref:acyl-CoA dehydrogenase family protein n=1 Tax=Phyllobacterium sp. 21LDTY02-6 TaxID=2944903 RepID=UPI0020214946|nr:acyl-CoA dehydrogenase family protein [Phyllobacterium sp. 21LDTY02-6]MCO4319509.1 acyl-CoA dehydrogenase family protein [Phyllobacterium sp. 21LDTY02-6]
MSNLSNVTATANKASVEELSVVDIAKTLAPAIAARAGMLDAEERFADENYALLKQAGLVEAAVPSELGGRGAEVPELAEMLRTLAQACGSTALAFSMHTHQVAIPAWRWRHQKVEAVAPLLKRVASERIILLSSGGSDWIGGSGTAEKVEGGYRINARKAFTSGAEAGTILMTGAIHEGADGARTVVHFGVPMAAAEVRVEETWHTLGMRGTASNDVIIDGLFVPDASVAFSRRAGEWHPLFQVIATIAFPLIYAVYLGVAERARDIAVDLVRKRPPADHLLCLAGRMDTALKAARIAHGSMLEAVARNAPSAETVNDVMIGRTLVARHAIETTELAMELAGGAGFYRSHGLERCFRDVQGARYHPLQPSQQARYAGAMALGQSVAEIY